MERSADPTGIYINWGKSIWRSWNSTTEVDGDINTGWGRIEWGLNAWGEFGTALPTGNCRLHLLI